MADILNVQRAAHFLVSGVTHMMGNVASNLKNSKYCLEFAQDFKSQYYTLLR